MDSKEALRQLKSIIDYAIDEDNSHSIPLTINFYDENFDKEYEVMSVDTSCLNCGCVTGVAVLIKEKE